MKGKLYIRWYGDDNHKEGPFDAVYFHHLNQTVPQCNPLTVTYSCWDNKTETSKYITVPVDAHSIVIE